MLGKTVGLFWFLLRAVLVMVRFPSDGFPKTLLEAIACGTPAVVIDVGDCKAVAKEYGIVVHSGDAQAFSRTVVHMLVDHDYWLACRERCQAQKSIPTWQEVASLFRAELLKALD